MPNIYIKSLPVNLFGGIFNTTIHFSNGLNIISGVNGTGKTEVLKQLKGNAGNVSEEGKTSANLAIFAISPKRNTEKQTIDSIVQIVRSQNKTSQAFLNTISGFQIKDSGFESYPSFAELFIQEYELLMMEDGSIGHDSAIHSTTKNFNEVLQQVFPDYEIEAKWITGQAGIVGKLDLKIKKYGTSPITIEKLSTGESEVFALLFSIFVSRDKEDVYLIDEPEIHLNWDLEKGLFNFFNWFCEKFNKQIIVVTHSRIIFSQDFYSKTQFLLWEDNEILCKPEITAQQKSSIAGEISNIVNVIGFSKLTFFVEDEAHKIFVSNIAKILDKEVEIIVCRSKPNVKTMFELLKDSRPDNVFFLVDGDNEGAGIVDTNFISLQKYCIENYLLDSLILSKIFSKTEDEIKTEIVNCVKGLNDAKLVVFKKLADSVSPFPFEVLDTLDGSKISSKFVTQFGKTLSELVELYITHANTDGKLDTIFGEITNKLK